MDLTDLGTIKRILREYGAFAQKKLGQHFLIDRDILNAIVRAAELTPQDKVLEIGPGLGVLTRTLATQAREVIAIEKDPTMIGIFGAINSDLINTKIVEGNALALTERFFDQYIKKPYKLIANLPYYLTSAIIRFFLQTLLRPDMMILMVQHEVAERIVASPPNANILSVAVQFYGTPTIIRKVPREAFWPTPQVDSAILKIVPHPTRLQIDSEKKFFKVIKAGFGERRKQLHNSLAGGLGISDEAIKKILAQSHIASHRRAQTLTISEWIILYQNLKNI